MFGWSRLAAASASVRKRCTASGDANWPASIIFRATTRFSVVCRARFGEVTRLELPASMSQPMRDQLQQGLSVSDDLVFHASAVQQLRELLAAHKGTRFAVPEFKEWTGISRKYAIPLLEFLDRERVISNMR